MSLMRVFTHLLIATLFSVTSAPTISAEQKLADRYPSELAKLKAELTASIPAVDKLKKTAFNNARKAEAAAKAEVEAMQKRMGEINTAKALVAHAKGKWIGGADKGISAAKAKLKKASTEPERQAALKELAHWTKNRQDGMDALKERQAKFEKAEQDRPAIEVRLKKATQALASAKSSTLIAVKNLGLTPFLTSNKLDAKLAKYIVLMEATPQKLNTFAQQGKPQQQLIDHMLSSDKLLVQMMTADGAKKSNYTRAIQIYHDIWKASPKAAEGALQRLAIAISLEHAEPIKQRNAIAKKDAPATVDPVKRYLHYEKALLNGELDACFQNLTTWDYRMVVNGEEPDEILSWGRKMLRNYRPDHISTTDYRWRYVAAVRSDIRYGSQDNKYDKDELQFFQNILMNGGVCGRRAFFGRFMLRSFGVPTTARPQRGHAALAHWTPDGWVVCLGGGWGAGYTKTRYGKDLDFLANTQARATGAPFMQVKRAQWIGDVLGEGRVFGLLSGKPDFWNSVALYTQKMIITDAQSKTLAPVGKDIGEANETKEKVEITKATITAKDRQVSIAANGIITIPAAATSKPTKSSGKIIFMDSNLGGKQLHYSRTGRHQEFEYTINAPRAGSYNLTARVVTPSWKQNLLLNVNDNKQAVSIDLPFTVGMWESTKPVRINLVKGKNQLRFTRNGDTKGITIKDFTLSPASP
ncbi:MAG: hypothetical protein ACPG6P_11365 [Akkermansiaceae bacterium]